MKKYQLMGRKRVSKAVHKTNYLPLHIHSMPYEIVIQIFSYLAEDTASLLLLALVCSKFNNIVSKNFLYHSVEFHTTAQFSRFAQAHLPLKLSLGRRFSSTEASSRINYIRSVHIVNPPTNSGSIPQTQIAGTYTVDARDTTNNTYLDFVTHLKSLLNEAYGIKEVRISEISPQFEFPSDLNHPPSFSAIKHRFKTPKPRRSIEKIVLTAQSGWNIPFKVGHIALFIHLFDEVSELKLNKFVIHDQKLPTAPLEKPFSIECLVVTSSIYLDSKRAKRVPSSLLANTTSLLLEDIQNGGDLCLIDFIKANNGLSRLSIDVSSSIFYTIDPQDQVRKFNFSRYNNFFKLVCSGQGGYSKLREVVLTNFDLFNSFSHQHDTKLEGIQECDEDGLSSDEDSWIEPPTNTFGYFLRYLSQMPYLTIVVKEAPAVVHSCVNCGFLVEEKTKRISTLQPHEWNIILAPILDNRSCSVLIYDHNHQPLFSRRAEIEKSLRAETIKERTPTT